MSQLLEKLHQSVHSSWQDFLTEQVLAEIEKIDLKLQGEDGAITPNPDRVLHFLTQDLYAIKVLILGQDPYPQSGVATGRAFEVGTLNDWHEPFRNVSLKNIVRAIYHAETDQYLTYNNIKKQLGQDDLFGAGFKLLPPNKLFKFWEEQGVLLLNTSFTCKIGSPGSHAKIWADFTRLLLEYINSNNAEINWFLWGGHAKGITEHLTLKHAYVSNHPMICKEGEKDFLFGEVNPFRSTAAMIDWAGKSRLK